MPQPGPPSSPIVPVLARQIAAIRLGDDLLFEAVIDADRPTRREVFVYQPRQDRPAFAHSPTAGMIACRHVPHATVFVHEDEVPVPGPLGVRVNGQAAALPSVPAETALFAGRRTLIAQCNGETAANAQDWLAWHAVHHRADAALIVHRGTPDAAAAFRTELAARIGGDGRLAAMGPVMVLGFDAPLGRAGAGPEADPMYAPDAPGKDRMTAPEPDPWSAPLGFTLLYDLLRARFLGRAAAVARLELADLLHPGAEGRTVFDALTAQDEAVILLVGERAYPWAQRREETDFGDHSCLRFDASEYDRSWCLQPDRLPQGVIWMPYRIVGAKPRVVHRWGFWRCMALRYGSGKVSRIVARSALQEDAGLLAMGRFFGAEPERISADTGNAKHLPAREVTGRRTAVVTTMKNEGPFILEWIAYHRAIGVEDFLVYTNDCTDGTDGLLQLLMRKGIVEWRENPYRESGMKPQHAALDAANSEDVIRNADWAICMDVDEYIAVHTGDGTLNALFDAVPDANMIALTWRLFGNADIHAYRDGFITQQFTQAAREMSPLPHQAWGFKTLFKNVGLFKKLGVHRPKGLRPQAVRRIQWVNGSGRPMPEGEWRSAWRSNTDTYGYDLVSLNHYAVRSADSFLVKRDRGRVNHVDRDQGMAYWFRMNHNVVEDRRMERALPRLRAEYDRLMADPEIAAAHAACVAAHRAKIAELKAEPDPAAFHAAITAPRAQRLARLHGHFGLNVYLAGPEVIPEEIALLPPEAPFHFNVDRVAETQH
ncbi:glycosyltransferase family 2 protein [Falsirhodobacter algicola]|uniref:glycosyltransferase family 2 protein n=1 Tax=Falsirhodobacter algicola TaxID=2692330 RepID=UPI002012C530|nr:glycosyltransferase family 2 protein [Falsirhodobacter algicola]